MPEKLKIISEDTLSAMFPMRINFELAAQKGLVKDGKPNERYRLLLTLYYRCLNWYLNRLLHIDDLEAQICSIAPFLEAVPEEDQDIYQQLSKNQFFYVRSPIYIEKLTESEMKELIKDFFYLDDEGIRILMRDTLSKVIVPSEENTGYNEYFGPGTLFYLASVDTLVIGLRFKEEGSSPDDSERFDNAIVRRQITNRIVTETPEEKQAILGSKSWFDLLGLYCKIMVYSADSVGQCGNTLMREPSEHIGWYDPKGITPIQTMAEAFGDPSCEYHLINGCIYGKYDPTSNGYYRLEPDHTWSYNAWIGDKIIEAGTDDNIITWDEIRMWRMIFSGLSHIEPPPESPSEFSDDDEGIHILDPNGDFIVQSPNRLYPEPVYELYFPYINRRIPVRKETLEIGRKGPLEDILASYKLVSRTHAHIVIRRLVSDHEKKVFITDHNSRNGTFVNNEALESLNSRELSDGDRIRLGPPGPFLTEKGFELNPAEFIFHKL